MQKPQTSSSDIFLYSMRIRDVWLTKKYLYVTLGLGVFARLSEIKRWGNNHYLDHNLRGNTKGMSVASVAIDTQNEKPISLSFC